MNWRCPAITGSEAAGPNSHTTLLPGSAGPSCATESMRLIASTNSYVDMHEDAEDSGEGGAGWCFTLGLSQSRPCVAAPAANATISTTTTVNHGLLYSLLPESIPYHRPEERTGIVQPGQKPAYSHPPKKQR